MDRVVERGAGTGDVERSTQRVVDADDDRRHGRPQPQGRRELALDQRVALRPELGDIVILDATRLGQALCQQGRPATPSALRHRITHADRDRVAERDEPDHYLTTSSGTVT